MPQLDKFTFAPQVFWLILGFFAIYFVLLSTGLPRIYKILLFRKNKLELYYLSFSKLDKELYFSGINLDSVLSKSLATLKNLFESSSKLLESEVNNSVEGLKTKDHNLLSLKKSINSELVLRDLNVLRILRKQSFYQNTAQLKSKILK